LAAASKARAASWASSAWRSHRCASRWRFSTLIEETSLSQYPAQEREFGTLGELGWSIDEYIDRSGSIREEFQNEADPIEWSEVRIPDDDQIDIGAATSLSLGEGAEEEDTLGIDRPD
jgi:hypothetical protein